MKFLLYAGIMGFSCWIISEGLEIAQGGYSPTVYHLTTAYHFLAGLGVWGLYRAQTISKNTFNLVGAAIAAVAYLALTFFPIQVMYSGLSFPEFMSAYPIYKLGGFIWFLGMILFSISIIRTGFFPRWAGVVMLIGTLIFTATPLLGWPTLLVNFTNILFGATVIYISILGLRTSAAHSA